MRSILPPSNAVWTEHYLRRADGTKPTAEAPFGSLTSLVRRLRELSHLPFTTFCYTFCMLKKLIVTSGLPGSGKSMVAEQLSVARSLAREQGAELLIIECVCSDAELHRKRVESRRRNIPGMAKVTWERVEERRTEYEPWTDNRLVLNTIQGRENIADAAVSYVRNT